MVDAILETRRMRCGDCVEWEELENFKLETRYPVDLQSIFDFIPFPNPSYMVVLGDHHL